MLTRRRRRGSACGIAALLAACAASCQQPERLHHPSLLRAPYAGQRLWAVVPPANESGVSFVDTARIADAIGEQIESVDGLHAVPVNRTIAAMRDAGLEFIRTPGEAMALLNVLGADGLVTGTVTVYDPYRPPRLGLAVQLFARDMPAAGELDPVALSRSPQGEIAPAAYGSTQPVAQVAEVFDAANHRTLAWLREYAAGRSEPRSAYGADIYLVSMDLYTQFVGHRLVRGLLDQEQLRAGAMASQDP
jgi:hypothetical protein